MLAPIYGVLQSIRTLLELDWVSSTAPSGQIWSPVLRELVEACRRVSEVVSPVVCSSSPEGFLLDATPPDGMSSEPEVVTESSSSVGNAQSLLLCCWHSMKEVSLLLGYIVDRFGSVVEAGVPLLALEQVL